MHSPIRNIILTLLVPTAILVGAWLFLPRIAGLPVARQELLPFLPYLTMATGMFLSLHFHRGRIFFILLLLSAFYWSFRSSFQGGLNGLQLQTLYQAFCVLIPANMTLFCLMRERGVLTLPGRLRLIFIALQGGLMFWATGSGQVWLQLLLSRQFTSLPAVASLTLPQSSLPVFAVSFLVIGARAALRRSPIDGGLLGALVAVAVACNGVTAPNVTSLFIGAAGLILTLSVMQDSYNMAFRDDLTGLPSRRALNEQMTWLGRRYAIAMVDVDHFKKFNDTYGHDVGDQVLRMVAGRLARVTGGGKVFRYGGEEFTVVFQRKGVDDAAPHLEELRRDIADYQLWLRGQDRARDASDGKKRRGNKGGERHVSVTVSIGVAETGNGLKTPGDVITAADRALYRAKQAGRNRLCS